MRYSYVAVNSKGRKYTGDLVAESKHEAMKNLQSRGLTAQSIKEYVDPKSIEAQKDKSVWQRDIGVKDIHEVKVKKKIIMSFCNQMGIMMKAGISLSNAMEIMLENERNGNMRKIIKEITTELYNGIPLSSSMQSFRCFSELLVSIVRAGESNGRLDIAFEQGADIIRKEIKLSGKIKSAMFYPVFLIFLTFALVIILSVFVIPKYESLFKSYDSELPGITKAVMGFSHFLIDYWYVIIIVAALLIAGLILFKRKNENFAMFLSKLALDFPVIGRVLRQNLIARFCNMMAMLTSAGVSILHSLELSRDVMSNLYVKDCLDQVIEDVKIGTPINTAMGGFSVFDSMLLSMVKVGEESGMLTDSLMKVAVLYEEQTEESTKRLTEALTPAMTIIVGLVVGIVVVSIVIPMFGISNLIQ